MTFDYSQLLSYKESGGRFDRELFALFASQAVSVLIPSSDERLELRNLSGPRFQYWFYRTSCLNCTTGSPQ